MDLPLRTIALLLVAALDVIAIGRVLLRAHGIEGSLVWIFAILIFPGFGSLAYLGLAHPRIGPTTRRKQLSTRLTRARLDGSDTPASPREERSALASTAVALTELEPRPGNAVRVLAEDAAAFEAIEEALSQARHSIWVEFYIVRNDQTGRRFLSILSERARAGIEVRLLYDAVGSVWLGDSPLKTLRAAGGAAEMFLPLNPLRRRWSIHLRNHRKIVLVDGRVVFTGGMNVGDEYSGRSRLRGKQHFHDTHLLLEGPAARDFALVFAEDWAFATGEELALPPVDDERRGEAQVCVVPSGPDQDMNASRMLYFAGIGVATERLWLTSPYFVPDLGTRMALLAAAVRGVDVRLLLPARNDVRLVGLAARAFFEGLVRGGVRIFEFQPSMLHAKTMVVDGCYSIIGSANVDMRSFRWNFELSVLVEDMVFATELEKEFLEDLARSREVTLAELELLSPWKRLLRGAASLLSPML